MAYPRKPVFTGNKITTSDVKRALPEHYLAIAEKTFEFKGKPFFVKIRITDLPAKPPLYLYDNDNSCFVSSLYYNPGNGRFYFDVKTWDKREFWSIDKDLKLYQEEKGYYPNNSAIYDKIKKELLA